MSRKITDLDVMYLLLEDNKDVQNKLKEAVDCYNQYFERIGDKSYILTHLSQFGEYCNKNIEFGIQIKIVRIFIEGMLENIEKLDIL